MSKCLFDTNIISEILKNNLSSSNGIVAKLIKANQIIIPLVTIAELSQTTDLIKELIDFSQKHKVIISKSSRMLFEDEIESYSNSKTIDIKLIDLTESVLNDEFHMRKYFQSDKFLHAVNKLREEINTGLNNLNILKNYKFKHLEDYMRAYLSSRLKENVLDEFKFKKDDDGVNHFHSISLQGAFLYYKYITKDIKINRSDTFDSLMIPTLPYVDIFLTERTNCGLLKELTNKVPSIKNLLVYSLRDLKNW